MLAGRTEFTLKFKIFFAETNITLGTFIPIPNHAVRVTTKRVITITPTFYIPTTFRTNIVDDLAYRFINLLCHKFHLSLVFLLKECVYILKDFVYFLLTQLVVHHITLFREDTDTQIP